MQNYTDQVNAGIVLYNPDTARLKSNIDSICKQVNRVVIVDNHSLNIKDIKKLIQLYDNVCFIRNNENLGIATALNQIFKESYDMGVSWVYTLDQDTISPSRIIIDLMQVGKDKVGIICPKVYEERMQEELTGFGSKKYKNRMEPYEVDGCITSGSLTNIKAWKDVNGFDEYMFIDYVDFDFALSLRKAGYKIIQMPNVSIQHELGDTKIITIFKWKIRVTKHSPMRKYYMGRNIIYFMKKHKHIANRLIEILRLFKIELFIILFEQNKLKQQKEFFKGIKDGLKYKIG